MKIHAISDLHLEFQPYNYELPDADVCLLAGDITLACEITRQSRTGYHTRAFFDRVQQKYARTFYIPGNHEYYHGDWKKSHAHLRKFFRDFYPNVKMIQQDFEFYKGVTFIGATLWTDFNRANPLSMLDAVGYMSDYNYIYDGACRLTPHDVLERNHKDREFIQRRIKMNSKNKDNKIVVMTHHQPSFQSVHVQYSGSPANCFFCSDFEHLLTPQVKAWVAGHVHNNFDYMIGETRMLVNPRGYQNENPEFNPSLVFEV